MTVSASVLAMFLVLVQGFCVYSAIMLPSHSATDRGGKVIMKSRKNVQLDQHITTYPITTKQKSYSIQHNRFVCRDVNRKYFQELSCKAKPISYNDELINASATLWPNVTLDDISVGLTKRHR